MSSCAIGDDSFLGVKIECLLKGEQLFQSALVCCSLLLESEVHATKFAVFLGSRRDCWVGFIY